MSWLLFVRYARRYSHIAAVKLTLGTCGLILEYICGQVLVHNSLTSIPAQAIIVLWKTTPTQLNYEPVKTNGKCNASIVLYIAIVIINQNNRMAEAPSRTLFTGEKYWIF